MVARLKLKGIYGSVLLGAPSCPTSCAYSNHFYGEVDAVSSPIIPPWLSMKGFHELAWTRLLILFCLRGIDWDRGKLLFYLVHNKQLIKNWYGQGESDCLIKT
ncbi:hypothetical protein SeLEV6574_g08484 [Synchytrium endobioticum]|uniref:Uncharacterized protein n=1 Tax=Synchytrium endobioticum TaxID=286115 RepID=A0A507C3K8_9FUNG|nr:hypothetical protein SeLEV6574_g08484 [Synchytrium endobioticum]